MSERSTARVREHISDGWWAFHNDNYYNPTPHDEQAELRAQLDFARKAEAVIQVMFPENLADLTLQFAKFSGVDLANLLSTAALDDPNYFYPSALAEYREVQTADSPDILDFGLLVRDFRQVVDPIWEKVKQFPADFFSIYYKSRDWLFEHVFAAIVDLLSDHLRHLATGQQK